MHSRSLLIGIGLAVSALLASCGGGSGSDSGGVSGSGSAPSDTLRLDCYVFDFNSKAAVADAAVNYQGGQTEYTAQTNTSGNCRLDLPASEVANIKFPAATVTKAGYEPQTILCESLQAGRSCTADAALIPLTSKVSIPVGSDVVMHLGDDLFSGTNNSQFQKTTDGGEASFAIPDWAEKAALAGVTQAVVLLDAKGWQTDVCSNRVSLAGDAGTETLPGGNSPSEGYWAGGKNAPFVFDLKQVGRLSAALKITSGTCSGTSDLDDFEINRVRVYFCGADIEACLRS